MVKRTDTSEHSAVTRVMPEGGGGGSRDLEARVMSENDWVGGPETQDTLPS